MALYTYKAIDGRGKSVMGRVEAVNLFDLEQRLLRMELDLVSGAPSSSGIRFLGGRVTRQDLINFCFHLEQLASSGVLESIEGGKNLSSALGEFPEVFSKVFVSLVRSGEQTGKLSAVLKSLTE